MADKPVFADQIDLMFRALCDRTRLRILSLLRDGELCEGDFVAVLRVPTARRYLTPAWPSCARAGLVLHPPHRPSGSLLAGAGDDGLSPQTAGVSPLASFRGRTRNQVRQSLGQRHSETRKSAAFDRSLRIICQTPLSLTPAAYAGSHGTTSASAPFRVTFSVSKRIFIFSCTNHHPSIRRRRSAQIIVNYHRPRSATSRPESSSAARNRPATVERPDHPGTPSACGRWPTRWYSDRRPAIACDRGAIGVPDAVISGEITSARV